MLFDKANRLIIIEAPTTEVSIQELINAIRDFEDDQANMDIPHIAEATGKADLGGGLLVGITLKLLDWKLKFESRSGPDTALCDVRGGNLVAVDENNQPMNPIEPAAYVTVTKTSSVAAALIAEWSQTEKQEVLTKTGNLPADPASKSELEIAHGLGSWEGATPTQVWDHTDRKLTSRNIVSEVPGDHISSESQIEESHALLNAIKGAGFDTTKESLVEIRELIEKIKVEGKAHAKV